MRFLRFGVFAIVPMLGLAQAPQCRGRLPRPASTAAPALIEMGGPEWGFAHANPAMLASFNLADLLKSTIGQWIFVQAGRSASLSAAEMDKLKRVLGEIDNVSISAQAGSGPQADAVVLLTGHFERQLLARLIQASGGPAPRMLDAGTMLMGDSSAVAAAVGRISSSWNARRTDPLIVRARRLTATYDFWITGPPPAELAGVTGGGVRSFTFGMSFGAQIRMALALDTVNAQSADRILAAYRKLEEAGRRGAKAREWGEATRSLRIERLSPGIQFSIADAGAPPEEMLAQLPAIPMLQPLKSSASIHAALATLDLSNAAPSAPVSRKIVITGLDGSREVPAH